MEPTASSTDQTSLLLLNYYQRQHVARGTTQHILHSQERITSMSETGMSTKHHLSIKPHGGSQ